MGEYRGDATSGGRRGVTERPAGEEGSAELPCNSNMWWGRTGYWAGTAGGVYGTSDNSDICKIPKQKTEKHQSLTTRGPTPTPAATCGLWIQLLLLGGSWYPLSPWPIDAVHSCFTFSPYVFHTAELQQCIFCLLMSENVHQVLEMKNSTCSKLEKHTINNQLINIIGQVWKTEGIMNPQLIPPNAHLLSIFAQYLFFLLIKF